MLEVICLPLPAASTHALKNQWQFNLRSEWIVIISVLMGLMVPLSPCSLPIRTFPLIRLGLWDGETAI